MSFLLALALGVTTGCASDVAQLVDTGPPPAVVSVAVDSTTLLVGNTARASATVLDSSGNPMSGRAVTWTSLSPNVVKVSPEGVVTAVSSGAATIQGTVSGTAGLGSLTVVVPPNLASNNFDAGTWAPFVIFLPADEDIIGDPTGSNRSMVARFHYAGTAQDRNRGFQYTQAVKWGQTIFTRGTVYFPVTDLGDGFFQRKLLYSHPHVDYSKYGSSSSGGPVFWSVLLMYGNSLVDNSGYVRQNGTNITIQQSGLATLKPQTWYTIEKQITMESSIGAGDGVIRVWLNGVLVYEKTGMTWTDPAWVGQPIAGGNGTPLDINDIYFDNFNVGDQVNYNGSFDEYRYWDNVAFSTQRIGK